MKTSYKVALIAAGVLCICVLAYSFLPDRSSTMSPAIDQGPQADRVDQHRSADGGSPQIPLPTAAAGPTEAVTQPDRTDKPLPIPKPAQPTEPAPQPTPAVDKKPPDTSASENVKPVAEDETPVPVIRPQVITVLKPPPQAERPPKQRKDQTYTIKSGDTFAAIAQTIYGSERHTVAISLANPDIDPKRLQPGQVIQLPDVSKVAPADSTTAKLADGSAYYVVRAKDTLSRIAKRHYNDPGLWRIIYRANRTLIGPDPDRIQPGTRLVIPAHPTTVRDAR